MRLSRPAARRLPAALLVAVAALGTAPLAATPAAATPAAAAPAPVARAVPEPALPVTVTITGLEPRDVRAGAEITVTAVLRNTTDEATGPLRVRLERGGVLTTRGELTGSDTDPRPTSSVRADLQDVDAVGPGRTAKVTYRSTTAALGLGTLGVYPLALSVLDEDFVEVGRAQTLLPFFDPRTDPVGTRVALFWPLLDRPHRLVATAGQVPVFDDDSLGRSVRRGGRLDRLLTLAERATGPVRLTIAIDPETIEELQAMSAPAGYQVADPRGRKTGTNGPAAKAWLDRLRAIAPEHLVMSVPYGDPDLVARARGGRTPLARPRPPDLHAAQRALGVRPTTDVVWPPDGQLTDTTLDEVVGDGADAVVLDRTALPGGPAADAFPTSSGVSPLPALGGDAVALVADPSVQRLVTAGAGRADTLRGGPRLAEQRVLAELAMITAEQPSNERTLVIAPPRRWDPTAGYAAGLLADLTKVPWLKSVDALEAAQSTDPVDRGPLVYPAGAQRREVSADVVQAIVGVQAQVADFRSALANPNADQLASYPDALRRAGSSAWRTDPRTGRIYAGRLQRQIAELRSQVTMTAPSSGNYTLTSSDSPLLVTVQNNLDVPVRVRVRMDVPYGFEIRDPGEVEIQPGQKRSLRLTASVQRTGTFKVTGRLITPAQGTLGEEITLSVRSTAYGGLALGVTGMAFVVLVAAVVVRLVRRLRARPGPPVAAGSPADRSIG